MSDTLNTLIAKTIKKADKSYFWEDYTKQAIAVRKALKSHGYVIVPTVPCSKMIEAGMHKVMVGRTHVDDLAKKIYTSMIACAEDEVDKKDKE